MNKQQLASKIWKSADTMRSKIEANEYKDYILGFIFYKFLSDKELRRLKSMRYPEEKIQHLEENEENAQLISYIRQELGYFIAYKDLFSTWLDRGSEFSVGDVTDALSDFNRQINPSHKNVFSGIFNTLETGLSKLGDTSGAQTKAIRDLIFLIKDIPMDGRQDYDVLGFIYEYLISNFAASAGKKAGEFYTPHEVSLLMSEIVAFHLKDRDKINIYDPTSGSGSLLINIGKCFARHTGHGDAIKYFAQELKENTYNLTRMNLVMRDISPYNIETRNGDTLEEDWPIDSQLTGDPLRVDAVVSNPPYSQSWNPSDKDMDPRFKEFGLAPQGKADYAFLLHDLFHLKPDGVLTIVLPHGVLFRGDAEGEIRENLIEENHIDAIIGLPPNIFFGTGIPTIIMVLRQSRPHTDVLIVDASKGFEKVGKNNILRARDIKKIVDVVTGRLTVEGFSRAVPRDEVRANGYNLNIPRYVNSSEGESWDVYSLMFGGIPEKELLELQEYWDALPNLKRDLFAPVNEAYSSLQVPDLKKAVLEHPDVATFISRFSDAFNGFESFLYTQLIENALTLNIATEEGALWEDMFARLKNIPLVDKYDAYQLLDDDWKQMAMDLEMIQTEGFSCVKQTEPNMVIKKKNGKDHEVQDGWKGHILPFELVQKSLFPEKLARLKSMEDSLASISGEYETWLDELSEEDKDKDFVNEDKDAFVAAEVKRSLKAKTGEPRILGVLEKVNALITREKELKKDLKEGKKALHLRTREAIEALTDEQARELLRLKWISSLVESVNSLPQSCVSELARRLEELREKYKTTYAEVEQQITDTEIALVGMLDELRGNEFDMKGITEFRKLQGGI